MYSRRLLYLCAAACISTSAGAAPAAKPQYNIDDPTRNPYQQLDGTSCTLAGACQISFPALTANTLVLNASCTFSLSSSATITTASLGSQNFSKYNFLPVTVVSTLNGSTNYVINAATYLNYSTGEMPFVQVFASGAPVQAMICNISGYSLRHPS